MTFEEVIQEKRKLIYKNVGVSMLPWIHEGKDLMVIESLPENLEKYDTVLFIRPNITGRGRYVLHRIIKCYEDGTYYIMGDNTRSGEIVKRENIIGILTMIQQPGKLIKVTDRPYRIKVWLWWHGGIQTKNTLRKIKGHVSKIIRKLLRIPDSVSIRAYFKLF